MLRVRGLTKSFDRPAVDQLDLEVRRGELYALLGANGAGKTTTLRMIVGLLPPDHGTIEIDDIDAIKNPQAAKQVTAWLPDEPLLYDRLSPIEYLEFIAGLWQVPKDEAEARAEHWLNFLGLWPHRGEYCEGFSRGMRQKLALAGALLHEPKLLILDEPLSGLDAAVARQVKNLLRERVERGFTVILTTHILEVAERLADRIGIIARGKLIAEGSFTQLRDGFGDQNASLEDMFLHMTGH